MNRQHAKQVLLAYRPGSRDAADPDVAAALHFARSDQELSAWLEDQIRFHGVVRGELRRVPLPDGLKERILAERPRVIVPLWQRSELLLAAACLVIGLLVAGLWVRSRPSEETFAGFRSRMIGAALRVYRMDIVTNNPSAVRDFLAAKGAPADYSLTSALESAPVKGGARLWWQGHPVSMVCFQLPKNETLFMFVLEQSAIRGGTLPGGAPELAAMHGVATACWSRGGKVYLIAAPADAPDIKKYLDEPRGNKLNGGLSPTGRPKVARRANVNPALLDQC